MVPRSRFKGKWVWVNTCFSDYSFKVKILNICREADSWCYLVLHESGEREPIFVNSVTRIFPLEQKKAKVIDIKTRVRLVKKA